MFKPAIMFTLAVLLSTSAYAQMAFEIVKVSEVRKRILSCNEDYEDAPSTLRIEDTISSFAVSGAASFGVTERVLTLTYGDRVARSIYRATPVPPNTTWEVLNALDYTIDDNEQLEDGSYYRKQHKILMDGNESLHFPGEFLVLRVPMLEEHRSSHIKDLEISHLTLDLILPESRIQWQEPAVPIYGYLDYDVVNTATKLETKDFTIGMASYLCKEEVIDLEASEVPFGP